MERRQSILGFVVGIRLVLNQQRRHVRVTLLGAEMKRRETGLGLGVSLGAVFQQRRGDVHLQEATKWFRIPTGN